MLGFGFRHKGLGFRVQLLRSGRSFEFEIVHTLLGFRVQVQGLLSGSLYGKREYDAYLIPI